MHQTMWKLIRLLHLNADELLIATGGKGVYKLNVNTCKSEPYITADYSSYNGMNGNNINDIYVDDGGAYLACQLSYWYYHS
mgnify:CR=1 FL=1